MKIMTTLTTGLFAAALGTGLLASPVVLAEEITSDNWGEMVGFKPDLSKATDVKKGKKVTKESLYAELNEMNGFNAYYPLTTVGPVTYSKSDREGVDTLQIYKATGGEFKAQGAAFVPEYVAKIK